MGFTRCHTLCEPPSLWAFSQRGLIGSLSELPKNGFWSVPCCVSPWVTFSLIWASISSIRQEGGKGS